MADKIRERALFEKARRQSPWFPPGDIVEDEHPDLVLVDGDDRIGIEVIELFQSPKHGSKFGPHVVAKFHRRIMEIAERGARSLPALDVLVYFDYRYDLGDAEECANALIEFVRSHPSGTYGQLDGIPDGFAVVRVAEPTANIVLRWRCLDSGETVEATREMIAAVITAKNRLVTSYRLKAARVWLLIACSPADYANSFWVSRDIYSWRFEFDFDKVLLLSSQGGVHSLLRHDDPTVKIEISETSGGQSELILPPNFSR